MTKADKGVRRLTPADAEHIKEALRACYAEFEELMKTKEWYVTSVTDLIESSLEILESEEV